MKNLKFLTLYTAVVLLIISCTVTEPLVPKLDNSFSIVDGDTVKTVKNKDFNEHKKVIFRNDKSVLLEDTTVLYKEPKLHTPPGKDPDLVKIKKAKKGNGNFRYVAIGGNLALGYRNGGVQRASQITAYPNLLARQMGVKNFRQPLFSTSEYNGTGMKTHTSRNYTNTVFPKFNTVENNLGVIGIETSSSGYKRLKMNKFNGQIDNFAGYKFSYPSYFTDSTIVVRGEHVDYASRFSPSANNKTGSLNEDVINQVDDIDFFTIEGDGQAVLKDYNPFKFSPIEDIIKHFAQNQTKGIIILRPTPNNFPINRLMNLGEVRKELKKMGLDNGELYFSGGDFVRNANTDYIYPTSGLDSLISPKVHVALKKGLSEDKGLPYFMAEINGDGVSIGYENNTLAEFAKVYNYPVVDLYKFYSNLINGFVTDDGIRIDAKDMTGNNFYAEDGSTLTAFGQAVITNEIIKGINSFYKTEIPLIPTREYLEK